ncbi:sensor histidine kinase [Flavobacterium sp. RHBU_24]|uniref:sensor histidine kinase n=1 Tax=Flavobacterium sp. RHBU_24 TaxID=3391185 RepID=UPI0039848B0B
MQTNIAYGIFVGLLFISLIILFCVLVIKLYINKIKTYTRLIYEKDLAFEKTLTTTILETQDQVLNDISEELHDDAGQQLTYIRFLVENLKLEQPELEETLEPVSHSVTLLSQSIRRASHSLNSQLMVKQNLVKAIKGEAERLMQAGRIKVVCTSEDDEVKSLDAKAQIVIYRVFQESINNILKHSGATVVTVAISDTPKFKLSVSDNGRGFDYDTIQKGATGMGLDNLVSRAAIIGLDALIKSAPGEGTTITLSAK